LLTIENNITIIADQTKHKD